MIYNENMFTFDWKRMQKWNIFTNGLRILDRALHFWRRIQEVIAVWM